MFNANSKRYEWIEMVLENDALDYYIAVDLQPDNTWTAIIMRSSVKPTSFKGGSSHLDRIDH